MQISPYLFFAGNCEQAIEFYHQAVGAHLVFRMTWGDMPDDPQQQGCDSAMSLPPEKIMHAQVRIGDSEVMMSDSPGEVNPSGFAISLSTVDVDEGKRWFDNLAAGGSVTMPWGETFWANGFGMLTDKFGIPWMVNAYKPRQ